ncbi:MAG: hypothetical protein FJ218_03860 [Ignavibacteria bacterium]|nr:hypothetical protein [Ignavibacteria bacterium]
MQNILTSQEINEQFHSEWVLLENPETNEQLEILRGKLLFHSKDRDEVYRKSLEIKPRSSAILFTGEIPEGTAVIL